MAFTITAQTVASPMASTNTYKFCSASTDTTDGIEYQDSNYDQVQSIHATTYHHCTDIDKLPTTCGTHKNGSCHANYTNPLYTQLFPSTIVVCDGDGSIAEARLDGNVHTHIFSLQLDNKCFIVFQSRIILDRDIDALDGNRLWAEAEGLRHGDVVNVSCVSKSAARHLNAHVTCTVICIN